MHKKIIYSSESGRAETFLDCGKCGSIAIIKLYISIIFFSVSSISPLIFLITLKLAEWLRKARETN